MNSNERAVSQLLSVAQVAHTTGLSDRAIYRAIERGDLRASKLCHRLRIRPADVESWIGAFAVEPSVSPQTASFPRATKALPREGGLRRLLHAATGETNER
jgi:excisionase family DNA binding protein